MKQGQATHSAVGSTKVEPKSMGINPQYPARMGMEVIPTKPMQMYEGRGLEAPKPKTECHPCGSQGKH
ncbi:MAG: hypothetical protein ACREHG_04525 [Candidatus Saccharimonadales bacterium]